MYHQAPSLQDALWRGNALRTLPTLQKASGMLVCGEDLGMIPACVPPILEQQGLIGELLLRAFAPAIRAAARPQGWAAAQSLCTSSLCSSKGWRVN